MLNPGLWRRGVNRRAGYYLDPMPRGRLLAGVVVALVLGAPAGCGSSAKDSHAPPAPSKAAKACRAQWAQLGHDIAPEAALTQPSALPERWNSVAATIDYYRTSATATDCQDRIDQQQKAIAAIKAFSARLTGFDMQAQLALVQDAATAYAAGPWPPAPSPTATPGRKGKHRKKQPRPPRPPKPALVGAALTSLKAQAPVATQQQGPAWVQASVVNLDDPAAVAKALKDLQFLSTQSSGWIASQKDLALIRAALAAKTS